jgi:hypothetical protein
VALRVVCCGVESRDVKSVIERLDVRAEQGTGAVTEDFLRGSKHTEDMFEEKLGCEFTSGLRPR